MKKCQSPSAPIGVFDYGIGGLTVVKTLSQSLPNERFLFFADEARVNTPEKPSAARQHHTENALKYATFLHSRGAKMIIIACNLMSVYASDALQKQMDIPVIGLVEPIFSALTKEYPYPEEKKIAVFTTDIAASVQLFTKKLQDVFPGINVSEIACPRLAKIIDNGLAESLEADQAVRDYAMAAGAHIDAALLACTRFPILLSSFQKALPGVPILDPAKYLPPIVQEILNREKLAQKATVSDINHFYTTGNKLAFEKASENILGSAESFSAEHISSSFL